MFAQDVELESSRISHEAVETSETSKTSNELFSSTPGGGGYFLIWAIWGRAAGQDRVFWSRCPKQGVQFDLALS